MKQTLAGLLMCSFLVACGGTPPFNNGEDAGDGTGDGTDGGNSTGITRDGVPPGTESPSPTTGLFRSEIRSEEGDTLGNGFAESISYDGATDTFSVDNLSFDGANVYRRGQAVSSLNGEFAVYEAENQVADSVTGAPVNQFTHRAIYGVSRNRDSAGNPTTQFAIVRTGAYIPYGFGGFVYQRGGSVTLPTSGQAVFQGRAAGIRDFNGTGGVQYSTGDMTIAIDFEDFNDQTGVRGDGVRGTLGNRQIFDINGNDITQTIVNNINTSVGNTGTNAGSAITGIPAAVFTINSAGALDGNGDLIGQVTSTLSTPTGPQQYETGNYYAIVSGTDPDEIVGVLVLENTDDFENVTTRDSSGFIVYRDPTVQP